jgi:nickel transport protein
MVCLLGCSGAAWPAAAFDLFGMRTVDVQFATRDGKPMADAEVQVFSPDAPNKVAATGRTDKDGKFSFETDRGGLWTAEARNATEIARATVRVGGDDPNKKDGFGQSPYFLLGLLSLLLVLAIWFRYLRARSRAGRRPGQR